jgi:hypothetical protein
MPRAKKIKKAPLKIPPVNMVVRVRGKRAEIVQVDDEGKALKVIAKLPGRVPEKRLSFDDPNLGRHFELVFQRAVKHALRHG